VHLFDAMLSEGVEEFYDCIEQVRPATVALVEDHFNFLTKMCTVKMRNAALDMIRAAKESSARVAVSSSDATDHVDTYLDAGADAVLIGEPETTLAELLAVWGQPHSDVATVAGLALKASSIGIAGNGHAHRTSPRPWLKNLDALPFPAWDLVDVERYRTTWTDHHGRFSWNAVTSRGCPYKCNWCAKPVFGNRYIQRSPGDVAQELSLLRQQVEPDYIWYADDIFGLTERWILSFAEEVTTRDARIPFMMQSRVNLMTPPAVEALVTAGGDEVWLGVESGAQHILEAMDKNTTVEQVRSATRTLKEHGVKTCWFIQLGYLGEGWEDILKTRDLIREERPDDIGVSVSYPLPGTEFYDTVQQQLGRKRNWNDSDELAMMFRGTFSTEFYREARALLHDEVDARNGNGASAGRFDECWRELQSRAAEEQTALRS
jgi:anaerobic magnesium-protoporphyrin IX monomethyl ester cyclase